MPDALAVVDASLVIKALLPNQETARCQTILAHLQGRQLVAPALWVDEVTSILTQAVLSGQITTQEGEAALHQALALGVQIILPDENQARLAYQGALKLRQASTAASFYLVAAEGLGADFWTADPMLMHSFQSEKPVWMHFIDEMAI